MGDTRRGDDAPAVEDFQEPARGAENMGKA
jgi:hypothetical protein